MEITHQQMVAVLVKPGDVILSELTPKDAHMIHMIMGISGEAGELLDAIKKKVIYRKQADRENIVEELGDIEFYLEGIRQCLAITREECLEANIAKLGKRYDNFQYTDKRAQDRADKSI